MDAARRPASRCRLGRPGRATLGLLLSLFAAIPGRPAETPTPTLAVEASDPRLEPLAARFQTIDPARLRRVARLVGLDRAGAPVRVRLVSEDTEEARRAPAWVSGYAYGNLNLAVVLAERAPAYPDRTVEEILLHEVAHVLVARAAGGHPVPRWFNEGLAMYAGGEGWGLADRSRLSWSLLIDREVPLAELATRFAGGRGPTGRAYAVSGAFVRDLLARHGVDTAARVLDGVALGLPFDEAFVRATGTPLERVEASFWRRHSFWYRWVPVLTSSTTLWIGISLLALAAIRRRRQRDAAMHARWEEEEAELVAAWDEEEPVN